MSNVVLQSAKERPIAERKTTLRGVIMCIFRYFNAIPTRFPSAARMAGRAMRTIVAACAVVSLGADQPSLERTTADLADRVKRLNERHLRISQEGRRIQQRTVELQQLYRGIQRDVQNLQVTAAVRIVQSAMAELSRDIDAQQARNVVTSKADNFLSRSAMPRAASVRGLATSAASYEAQRLAINNQIGQLDTVARLAVERLVKVIDQLAELSKAAETTQKDWDQLQGEYWSITDAQRRWCQEELRAVLDAMVPFPEDSAAAYVARAVARQRLGRTEDARQDFDAAIKLAGVYLPVALAAKGEFLTRTGKARDGVREFSKIPRTVKDARVSWLHAQALAADNRSSGAESAWKQVLQSGQYDEVAHWGLALVYGAPPEGRPVDADKALKHARSSCDLATSENWMCVDALAIAHAAGGDFDEAMVQARRAAELAFGDRRDLCLEHAKQFEAKQRVTWNWKE